MNILLIGGRGTIGKKIAAALEKLGKLDLIIAGRSSGDQQVDITSSASIRELFRRLPPLDAIVCTAGTGYYGDFQTTTEDQMLPGIKGKLLGQINLVLIGKDYLREGGSFTLTSGVAAEMPAHNGATVAMINGGINSFVLAAAQELKQDKRINAVSPGLVEDSLERYGALFPGYDAVPMTRVVNAYLRSILGALNGEIIKVYQ
jgi:NAD(P)-dependent dehydrogenase (short-subunit alcohol dehydrogenase family)